MQNVDRESFAWVSKVFVILDYQSGLVGLGSLPCSRGNENHLLSLSFSAGGSQPLLTAERHWVTLPSCHIIMKYNWVTANTKPRYYRVSQSSWFSSVVNLNDMPLKVYHYLSPCLAPRCFASQNSDVSSFCRPVARLSNHSNGLSNRQIGTADQITNCLYWS